MNKGNGYEQGYQDGFRAAQAGQEAVTRALLDGQYLHDLIRAVEWLHAAYEEACADSNLGNAREPWPCTCDPGPHYDADVNAWEHDERCLMDADDHFDALVKQSKERFAGVIKFHEPYPSL